MKKNIINLCLLFVAICLCKVVARAQSFPNEIAAFKKQDDTLILNLHPVVFAGSSSFTKWTNVQQYFPEQFILNRGFGGSTLNDLIYYADDVILKYYPKQVVIYCGENDLAYSDSVTPKIVLKRFKKLYHIIRNYLPFGSIVFISIKPSINRQVLMPKMEETNRLIQVFLKSKNNTDYIDVYHEMLDADGKPMADIFLSDNLHMNAKGYAIRQKLIEPYLVK